MAKIDTNLSQLPVFGGETGEVYRRYRAQVRWLQAGVPDDRQHLLAPLLIQKVTGEPAERFRDQDPAHYRVPEGLERLLTALDADYGDFAEAELATTTLDFVYKTRRASHESATTFSARFQTACSRTEGLITAEINREALKVHNARMVEYRENFLRHGFLVEAHREDLAAWQEAVRLDPDGDHPQEPEAPFPPAQPVLAAPTPFTFPSVLKGVLYLNMFGMPTEQQSQVIRACGGSTRLEAIEQLLRSSEMMKGGHGGHQQLRPHHRQHHHQRAYFAGPDYFEEGEGEEWWEDEEEMDDTYYGQEADEWFPEDGEDDSAWAVTPRYTEARRYLSDTRKARGFVPAGSSPPTAPFPSDAKGKGKSKGKSKGGKGSKGFMGSRSSSKGAKGKAVGAPLARRAVGQHNHRVAFGAPRNSTRATPTSPPRARTRPMRPTSPSPSWPSPPESRPVTLSTASRTWSSARTFPTSMPSSTADAPHRS